MARTSRWKTAVGMALVASAMAGCGDDAAVGGGAASVDPTAFATDVGGVIDAMHDGLAAATDDYVAGITDGPGLIDLERDWFVRSADLVDDARRSLPGTAADPLAAPYGAMIAALEAWSSTADGAASELEANRDTLAAGWETGERERFEALLAPVRDARGGFEDTCLDLAELAVAETGVAIDCLGRRETGQPTAGAEAAIGGVDLAIADGSGILLEPVTPTVVAVVDPAMRLDIIGDPVFADPSGPIDPLQLLDPMGWPEDMEAWLEAVGAELVGGGDTRVGEFRSTYWDVRTSLDRIADVTGGDSIPIAGSRSMAPAALIHLDPVIVVRLIRVDIDPATAFLASTFGADPDLAPELSPPPDLTPAPAVFAWLDETVLPALTMR